MLKSRAVGPICWVFLVVACQKKAPEPEAREAPPQAHKSQAAEVSKPAAPPPMATKLNWSDPPGWTRIATPSPMRLATYKLPRAPGVTEDAEMTVFHFGGGQGGSLEANFDRWLSQFNVDKSAAQRSDRSANGLSIHLLEIPKGTFTNTMKPGDTAGSKQGFGLLGAVVETPSGPYFFKITGPAKTLEAARPAFITLLDGVSSSG
jgi:hypothetical protein